MLVLVVVLLAVLLLLLWRYSLFYRMNVAMPWTPWPFFGHLGPAILGLRSAHDLIADVYEGLKGRSCGGIFAILKPVLVVREPKLVGLVTVTSFQHFTDHQHIGSSHVDPILANSLMFLPGKRWNKMRTTLSPSFTSSKLRNMVGLVDEVACNMVDHLKGQLQQTGTGDVEMEDVLTRFSNDVIASVSFDHKCDSFTSRDNEFYRRGKDITNFSGLKTLIFIGHVLFPSLMQVLNIPFISVSTRKFLTNLVTEAVRKRQDGGGNNRPDMIHLMMNATNADGQGLSVEEMAAQAMFFFLAGFDSTTNLLCFTTYLLALHPQVQEELVVEVDEVGGSVLDYETLRGMKYLDMVINESLRLYPPVPAVDRVCTQDYQFPTSTTSSPEATLKLRKGDTVVIPTHGIHRDPLHFPDPERFDPTRFAQGSNNVKPFTFLPFGSGPRACIAQRFAMMESKVALVHLLRNFTLHTTKRTPIPIKLSTKGVNMTVDGGFWLELRSRTESHTKKD